MSEIERRFRRLAMRAAGVLSAFALVSVLSPLGLLMAQVVAQPAAAQGYCSVNCADGSWCWVQGTSPCTCQCPTGGGAYCACQDIVIIIGPATPAQQVGGG